MYTAPIVKRIFKLYIEGNGIKEIAKTLNSEGLKTNKGRSWINITVSYILKNEAYTGTLIYGKKSHNKLHRNNSTKVIRIEDNHSAIIDKDTFNTVQKLMAKRSPKVTHPKELSSDFLLSGITYCGKCQAKMIGSSAKSIRHFYYTCNNYSKRGKMICDAKLINKEKIENLIIKRLKTHVLTEDNLRELFNIVIDKMDQNNRALESQLKMIDRQLESLQGKLRNLYNYLEIG